MIDARSGNDAWLRVEGLGFSHGQNRVLRDVSFAFHPGRHYVVAGPNGAGKSTLLDLLSRLRRPEAGGVRIFDRDAGDYDAGRLSRLVALAPQDYRLDFSFSVREIVAMGRRPYLDRWGRLGREDEDAVDRALAAMRLEAIAGKAVTALSGGERRRCVIARALAQATPILLLDEPGAGLDVARALSVMSLARQLAESGSLVITVSHDLNLAARYGHELVLLKDGAIRAAGPVEDTFTDAVLAQVYDVDARVGWDAFSNSHSASFRLPEP